MGGLAVDGGTPVRGRPFPSRRPFGAEAERLAVDALRSQRLFGPGGQLTARLEGGFAELYGLPHTVAVSSGTAALHTILGALDIEPGAEVITAPVTDAGTILPILYQHAVPVFADLDEHLAMDPRSVAAKVTPRTAGIVAVHLFGNATDVRALREIADRHGIWLVEDCSQAHVTRFAGRFLGEYGHAAAYSLQESKHMTCGDGGIAGTADAGLARRMRWFADKGWTRDGGAARNYPILGLNYRMTELQAAAAVPQLATVRKTVLRRQELGTRITAALEACPGLRPHAPTPESEHSYWLYAFEVSGVAPEVFARALSAEGVPAGARYIGKPVYACMDALAHRRTFGTSGYPLSGIQGRDEVTYPEGLCPRAEAILTRLVTIWPNEEWTDGDADDAATAIAKVARALQVR